MSNSFYGGPQGQSFEIKEIFKSRYGLPSNGIIDSMEADLSKGWTSPINVGEYVIISYGLPSDENYDTYKIRDINVDGKTYNSTLWKKIYNEIDGTANGLSYRMISSMTGNTPRIIIEKPSIVLDANQEPDVEYDSTDVDSPRIKFKLPQSQILSMNQPITVLDADEKPEVLYDESVNINRPTLTFKLPQSQRIKSAVIEEYLDVDEQPEIRLDIDEDGTINEPVLKLKLPLPQQLLEKNVTHEALDANVLPYIVFNATNANNPTLTFYLPRSQVMQKPSLTTLDPVDSPAIVYEGTVNEPKINFQLPRAARYYYGNLLGLRSEVTYTVTNDEFAAYGVGDYYINANTGFIYIVKQKNNDTTCTFDYIACIQAPLPEIANVVALSPYDDDGNQNIPKVEREYLNDEQTEWALKFSLPKAPKLSSSYEFLGSTQTGSVTANIADNDTVDFHFSIPTGSRLYSGTDEVINIADARPGDLYLNSNTGLTYKLQANNEWVKNDGSLKGPIGDALHIVRDYRIIETTTLKNSLENGRDYILSHYVDDGGNQLPLSPDEIFAITWVAFEDSSEISYWYYYTEDSQWGRVQLTGGISNLFRREYDNESSGPNINQAYSVSYVNKLIGGEAKNDDTDKLTTYSKEQLIDMLSWGEF